MIHLADNTLDRRIGLSPSLHFLENARLDFRLQTTVAGRGKIAFQSAHVSVVFVTIACRSRDILPAGCAALKPLRIALVAAHFRIDRVQQVIGGRRSMRTAAQIAGLFRRLARVIERPATLLDQPALAGALDIDNLPIGADRA